MYSDTWIYIIAAAPEYIRCICPNAQAKMEMEKEQSSSKKTKKDKGKTKETVSEKKVPPPPASPPGDTPKIVEVRKAQEASGWVLLHVELLA